MMRADLHPKSKCYQCKGCHLLKDPEFEGKIQCGQFERKEPGVWCADETIANFLRMKRIEHAYKR